MSSSRYIIGIDLGTTHSSVAYVDTNREKNPSLAAQRFIIPQLVAPGLIEGKENLPSFYFMGEEGDFDLPWLQGRDYCVGSLALEAGVKTPTRWISSAKSWLCNAAASRRDPILPIEAQDPSRRLSPVQVSAAYLSHIREAWDETVAKGDPDACFEAQEVVLTVPASFDEVARSLTVDAAKLAGFRQLTLLEEPQAAFYSWIHRHEKDWEHLLPEGSDILVCDAGGGTTDFSMIRVQRGESGLGFQRLAVGRHLLLGGDNLDLALAHYIESQLPQALTPSHYSQLRDQARRAKEALLSGQECFQVVLQGEGSSVVAGSQQVSIEGETVRSFLVDGFFGNYSWNEALQLEANSGVRTMGLPFESEPSVSKQLASFLAQAQGQMEGFKGPDFVLFNGGTMKPELFQGALLDNLQSWFGHRPRVLSSVSLDLAVSHGAAYSGRVRRGLGVRIGGGLPKAYYLMVGNEGARQALTLLARGTEEGTSYESERDFLLTTNRPVSFQLLSSQVRLADASGELVDVEPEEMQVLPSIHTLLRFGKQEERKIPVRLGISYTEIGTIELWLQSKETEHRWNLEFQLKTLSGQDSNLQASGSQADETFDQGFCDEAKRLIDSVFAPPRPLKPSQLMTALEETLEQPRHQWSISLLRSLWDTLLERAPDCRVSHSHHARWWNLAGYLLRPGYGYALDDHRMKDLWKVILSSMQPTPAPEVQIQQWIAWRRVAGGLNRGQQTQIWNQVLPLCFNKSKSRVLVPRKKDMNGFNEQIRCVASLELVDVGLKEKLGNALLERILTKEALPVEYWALGRLGARRLVHGTVANVVSRKICSKWLERLLEEHVGSSEDLNFVIEQLARCTDQREINVEESLREAILRRVGENRDIEVLRERLHSPDVLQQWDSQRLLGDSLPCGLELLEG